MAVLVHVPSGAVERKASARPSGSALASTLTANGPSRLGASDGACASVCAPSVAAIRHLPSSASTYSTDCDRSEWASPADYSPSEPGPAPPTTSTGAPGCSASGGATARHASLMLSEALATLAGASPRG